MTETVENNADKRELSPKEIRVMLGMDNSQIVDLCKKADVKLKRNERGYTYFTPGDARALKKFSSSDNALTRSTSPIKNLVNISDFSSAVKNLENVVFMFNTKSASKVIQSIGRSLRLHEDKESAVLYDIVFNTKYSRKHFRERMKLYKEFYNKDRPDEVVKISI